MKKLLILLFLSTGYLVHAQDTLPLFSVVQSDKTILISWKNEYPKKIESISIQRSYDSLKHYSTIGAVLNPLSKENGYTDFNPPFIRMYYRIFVSFEDGTYIITSAKKPIKLPPPEPEILKPTEPLPNDTLSVTPVPFEDPAMYRPSKREPWRVDPVETEKKVTEPGIKEKEKEIITYPSRRIFTSGDQQVIILLPDAIIKQYTAKFFDADGKLIFELKQLKEHYLILEKVYFGRSGWFTFEIYEKGILIEKNKLFIPQDKKKTSVLKSLP